MKIIVSNHLSGIGQVCLKYCKLLGVEPSKPTDPIDGEDVFMFCLPVPDNIQLMQNIKNYSKSYKFMTVCETETVHPVYGKLFEISKTFYVPSNFCKKILERQFPGVTCHLLEHWIPPPKLNVGKIGLPSPKPYIFYTIGNAIDPRKQITRIIGTFLELALPNSHLLIKATCSKDVDWKVPGVTIINGLVDDDSIQRIHNSCDCYVSFSNSEGVGMGAIEAALNNKPVIMQEYGGCQEYIKTPFMIKCNRKKIGFSDFLFTPNLEWGDPEQEELKKYMKYVYENEITQMDHPHTHSFVCAEKIKRYFNNVG
jgi:glycosyltransferase involved in cell wall biosynthesis